MLTTQNQLLDTSAKQKGETIQAPDDIGTTINTYPTERASEAENTPVNTKYLDPLTNNKPPLTTDAKQPEPAATEPNMTQGTTNAANTSARYETVTDTVKTPKNPRGDKEDDYSTPSQNGFRREVIIDHNGERMNIYYITPDENTRIASRPAMEQYLKDNPAEGLSIDNFCWQRIILGLNDPEQETVCTANPRRYRYSSTWSAPQMEAPPQLTFSDELIPMANTKSIHHDKPNNLPAGHLAPNIAFLDTSMQNSSMEHHTGLPPGE